MIDLRVRFEGRTPLVVHNVRLANPLDPYTKAVKAVTAKRSKTEDDHLELLRLEWEGGLYIDLPKNGSGKAKREGLGPYLPVSYPMACIKAAGAITRHKTAVLRGVLITAEDGGERIPIEYDGPRDIEGLWSLDEYRDVRMVRVNSSRTLRSRPRFPRWAITFRAALDEEIMDLDVFESVVRRAGKNIGIGEAPEGLRARFDATVARVGEGVAA